MMDILFTKYNRERLPEFQTETIIYKKSGVFFTRKKALNPEAFHHINLMFDNYNTLKHTMKAVQIANSELDGDSITFEYSDSPLLESYLYKSMLNNNKKLFLNYLGIYKQMIHKQDTVFFENYESEQLFENVFKKKVNLRNVLCLKPINIDLTFDNLTFDGERLTVIDYEWVFKFYLPVEFVMFRSVTEFLSKYEGNLLGFISISEIYTYLGIKEEHIEQFKEMEIGFQNYVFGESRHFSNASKVQNNVITLADLENINLKLKQDIEHKNIELFNKNSELEESFVLLGNIHSRAERLEKTIDEQIDQIKALELFITEKNQSILNKEGHIQQLLIQERELENIYKSSGWRLLKTYYKTRDSVIPSNSKARLAVKLFSRFLRNPKLLINNLNKSNLKKLKYYLSSEEASLVEHRIDSFMNRHQISSEPQMPIQLFNNYEYSKLEFDFQADPEVSIIIPVYNQFSYTYACLASILENTKGLSYEIIIADDMSTDETVNIETYIKNITVIRDGVNRGFLLNCNNAAKHAKGKYIFFLNNDTNVQDQWLDYLLQLIESDDTIGMVGSKLIYPDGRQQEAGGIIWNDASGWNFGRLDDPDKSEYSYVKEVDYISGAAILVRHDLWLKLGGFDEQYVPAYFEDTDLAFAIRSLGYKVMLQPRSVIVHFEGISHGTDTGSGIKSYQVTNKEKFLQKWKGELKRDQFANAEHVFLARDRSKYKKTIVVVDHYVPHYDKDAGGRCTNLYMKLMVSMGFRVIFIGDNFYRHEPYTSELQQIGIEVIYGNWYAKNINQWIKTNGSYIDYVYLNRPHISIKYIDTFKMHTKAKIIYFGHDLHYLREMRNYEITKNPSLLKSSMEWKETEFKLFHAVDVIHVVGSYEQKVLQEQILDKPIRNIPLFPYDSVYSVNSLVPGFSDRNDLLFVGGFNHKPNYDGIVWFIDHILPLIKMSIPDIKLFIVGSNPPDDLIQKQSSNIIITGYVTDNELERYYATSRVVVVPLRYGAGVKGKVVEALYHQVPVVTTSIGAEGLQEIDGVLTVTNHENEFSNAVIRIYNDANTWTINSKASIGYVEKYFTVEAAKEILSLDITNQENS